LVGAKAATLALLAERGFPVPEFFVIPSPVLAQHLSANGIVWPGDLEEEIVRTAPMPADVSRAILEAYERLAQAPGQSRVAVRSSGADEDGATTSLAGQFSSFLDVDRADAVLEAVAACWASYLSPRSLAYRAETGIAVGSAPHFAVIVQAQVASEKAGVLFTVHPLDPESGNACIEATLGSGDTVAGGRGAPDTLSIRRSDGQLIEAHLGSQDRGSPVLTEGETNRLLQLGLRIEEVQGGPQDIEWAFDAGGLWILQARPITALSPQRS
jgi:pyruvate,water dikinase